MEQDLYQAIAGSPFFPWAASTISGMIGFIAGNRAAIGRDARKHRVDTFGALRRKLLSGGGPVRITKADADAVLAACVWWRRKRLQRAVEQCNSAADSYHPAEDTWGQPASTPASEADMKAAIDRVARLLRQV